MRRHVAVPVLNTEEIEFGRGLHFYDSFMEVNWRLTLAIFIRRFAVEFFQKPWAVGVTTVFSLGAIAITHALPNTKAEDFFTKETVKMLKNKGIKFEFKPTGEKEKFILTMIIAPTLEGVAWLAKQDFIPEPDDLFKDEEIKGNYYSSVITSLVVMIANSVISKRTSPENARFPSGKESVVSLNYQDGHKGGLHDQIAIVRIPVRWRVVKGIMETAYMVSGLSAAQFFGAVVGQPGLDPLGLVFLIPSLLYEEQLLGVPEVSLSGRTRLTAAGVKLVKTEALTHENATQPFGTERSVRNIWRIAKAAVLWTTTQALSSDTEVDPDTIFQKLLYVFLILTILEVPIWLIFGWHEDKVIDKAKDEFHDTNGTIV